MSMETRSTDREAAETSAVTWTATKSTDRIAGPSSATSTAERSSRLACSVAAPKSGPSAAATCRTLPARTSARSKGSTRTKSWGQPRCSSDSSNDPHGIGNPSHNARAANRPAAQRARIPVPFTTTITKDAPCGAPFFVAIYFLSGSCPVFISIPSSYPSSSVSLYAGCVLYLFTSSPSFKPSPSESGLFESVPKSLSTV